MLIYHVNKKSMIILDLAIFYTDKLNNGTPLRFSEGANGWINENITTK